jgi:L,D-transpeptidase ErfK/SrfK
MGIESFSSPCFAPPGFSDRDRLLITHENHSVMAIFSFFNGAMWFRKMPYALLFILFINVSPLWATTHPMPPADVDLIGVTVGIKALVQDTLLDIARQYDLGQDEILLANPNVDRWLPGKGTEIVLPGRFIIPRAERKGVVLNLPEMRLYYFYKSGSEREPMVKSYPVSVGRMNWNTPLGKARIERKDRDPSWRPPESLKLEAIAAGEPLPDVVLPGPDNPLGRYALRLSIPGYLIHSTNKPYGVGMRVTHGCVRMYPEDIEELFPIIPIHTMVQIVNQPIKLGWQDKTLFLEVHPLMDEDLEKNQNLKCIAYEMILEEIENKDAILDIKTIKRALQEKSGMPVPITVFVADGFEF